MNPLRPSSSPLVIKRALRKNNSIQEPKLGRRRMSGTILGLPAAIFLLCTSVLGQQQVSHGPTDNGINPAFSSTYAGGYPVAGIDTVNLYNGHVSLNLPLGKIGARGSVGYSPTLSITRSFELRTYQTWTLAGSQVSYSDPKYKLISEGYMDSYNYSNFQPGLLPAVLIGRRTRDHNPSPAPFAPRECPAPPHPPAHRCRWTRRPSWCGARLPASCGRTGFRPTAWASRY